MSEKDAAARGEVTVISTISAREALIDLVPEFEHESGYKVNITYGPGPELAKRIREGMRADIFVGPEEFSGGLMDDAKLRAGSRAGFARSSTALAVKAGAKKPDISSGDKLKAALLEARAVSYSKGASGILFEKVLEKLGIADAVRAKLVPPKGGELVGAVVVRGDADIGVQQMSELLPVQGIEILGPLPPGLQQDIIYGTTEFTPPIQSEAGQAFVSFLKSETARKVFREKGLDPM